MSDDTNTTFFDLVVRFLNKIRASRCADEVDEVDEESGADQKKLYKISVIPYFGLNRNGRNYTREIVERMCDQFQPNTYGELGHPESYSVSMQSISHEIHRVFIQDDALWAEFSILNTPRGNELKEIFLELGMNSLALSPRGVGSIDANGNISDDYQIITYDFISESESSFRPYDESEIKAAGMDVFHDELLWNSWYDKPNYKLGDRTPRDVVNEGRGGEILSLLEEVNYNRIT